MDWNCKGKGHPDQQVAGSLYAMMHIFRTLAYRKSLMAFEFDKYMIREIQAEWKRKVWYACRKEVSRARAFAVGIAGRFRLFRGR